VPALEHSAIPVPMEVNKKAFMAPRSALSFTKRQPGPEHEDFVELILEWTLFVRTGSGTGNLKLLGARTNRGEKKRKELPLSGTKLATFASCRVRKGLLHLPVSY
jgi:hypothetical protein